MDGGCQIRGIPILGSNQPFRSANLSLDQYAAGFRFQSTAARKGTLWQAPGANGEGDPRNDPSICLCVEAGFEGVQVHAAHGYLLSQFLSPITNGRQDEWGGSLENRARFLLETVRAVRQEVGPSVALSVKLNSADFQKGGFDQEDSLSVAAMLEKEGIDLLEISGGNYESPSFLLNDAENVRESTKRREAYFIDFARQLRKRIKTPLMITGGFRSRSFCEEALMAGDTDLVGVARPFLTDPQFAAKFLSGELQESRLPELKPAPMFGLMSEGGWYAYQISRRLSRGKAPNLKLGAFHAVMHILWHETKKSLAHRIAG
ncbi:MAG: hypothetical protein KDK25_04710 [Leptospiraceae bacterium]|nr:hypothetical protein [Leptospiraceae bacterium]